MDEALGALTIRWAGDEDGPEPVVTDEFDQPGGTGTADEKSREAV